MVAFTNAYTPSTTITCRTWRGETYDLTVDLYAWTRSKSLSQPQGTFTLELVPRLDAKGKMWTDKIEPMDYIEIQASRFGKQNKTILRGFVDTVNLATAFGTTGGPSEPRITISGRDYAKLLLEWQILYLFTSNIGKNQTAQLAAQSLGFGLYYNFHLPITPTSITSFFHTAFSKMVDPIFSGLSHYFASLPAMIPNFDFPDFPMASLNVLSYTGSYWNLFEYLSSPPFGELFVADTERGSELVGRLAPYRTNKGVTPSPATALTTVTTLEDMTASNLSKSDTDLYNYFLTYGASTQLVGLSMPAFVTGKHNGVLLQNKNLYGVRPLQIDTSWIAEYDAGNPKKPNTNAIGIGSTLNEWLIQTQGENETFWSGTFNGHGNENYQIGTYVHDPFSNKTFYLTGINDSYDYEANQWTTQLTVIRGA